MASVQPDRPRKLFTWEEASAMLPLVKSIAQDLSQVYREVVERSERLQALDNQKGRKRPEAYGQEIQQIREEHKKDCERLQELLDELLSLGVEPKDPLRGLLDFPSLRDGRVVYLCWMLDEPEILYWHELDAGFAGRQPLEEASLPPKSHTLS